MTKLARKYHKWLMLFVGLQFLIWSVTGTYMVTMDIHFIHGESLIKQTKPSINKSDISYPMSQLMTRYPDAKNVGIIQSGGDSYFQLSSSKTNDKRRLFDTTTGEIIPLISSEQAVKIAQQEYAFDHRIVNATLIDTDAPSELSPRHLPVWQITFDHFSNPTLYVSQHTGQVVTKRHHYWRGFDWMWRFHIMDYDDGENVSNAFLLIIALLGLVAAMTGAVLTYKRFKPKRMRQS